MSPNLASPTRMLYNAVVVGLFAGLVVYGASPDDVTRPAAYVRWVLDLAAAHPEFAVPAAGLCLVAVLFGESSSRGVDVLIGGEENYDR